MKKRTLPSLLIAASAVVMAPAPAHAWRWDGHVHVWGSSNCGRGWYNPPTRIRIQTDNGEAYDVPVDAHENGLYSMDFQNVPRNGENAYASVYCFHPGGNGPDWGRTIRINRPDWNDAQQVDLNR